MPKFLRRPLVQLGEPGTDDGVVEHPAEAVLVAHESLERVRDRIPGGQHASE